MTTRYDDLSREELIKLLEARERRDVARFGLVWEGNEIERDKALNDDFVALDLDESLSVGSAPWTNLVIEGDNFDALRHLRMCYAGRVKCIFIDPPYNTGKKDFVYNDSFIDENDLWRHSKWCEFLYQRLLLARDLLTQDGVLFVCINDKNRAKLELLLDKVFPGRNVGAFVWRTRSGANDSKEYFRSVDHEFVLCYGNPDFTFAGTEKSNDAYTNPDKDKRGPWNSSDFGKAHTYKQRPNTFYPIQNPKTETWYACDPDNVWRFSSEARLKPGQTLRSKTMEQIIREEKVLWPDEAQTAFYADKPSLIEAIEAGTAPRNLRIGNTDEEKAYWDIELDFWVGKTIGYGKPRYKRHLSELKRSEKPFSSWLVPSAMKKKEVAELELDDVETGTVGGTTEGSSLVQEILGNKDFDYPKPLSLVETFLKQVTSGDDLVLDFFAGSGTTAHAVLKLNAEDEGNRRFILVSNSEATAEAPDKNLCRDVCARRVQRVIEGYSVPTRKGPKEVDGIEGDFAYLRTRRIAPEKLLRIEHAQVWTALQLTHLEVLEPYDAATPLQYAGDEDTSLFYVSRLRKKDIEALEAKLQSSPFAVVYSWQPELLKHHIRTVDAQFEAIPEALARRFGLRTH